MVKKFDHNSVFPGPAALIDTDLAAHRRSSALAVLLCSPGAGGAVFFDIELNFELFGALPTLNFELNFELFGALPTLNFELNFEHPDIEL